MIKMKSTDKVYTTNLFINDGHKVELLRLQPKSGGFVCYLPRVVVEALNLNESDHSLVCFIDESSSYTYLVLTKDSDLVQRLRPLILSRRQKAEALHKKIREQLQTQQQVTKAEGVLLGEVIK